MSPARNEPSLPMILSFQATLRLRISEARCKKKGKREKGKKEKKEKRAPSCIRFLPAVREGKDFPSVIIRTWSEWRGILRLG